MDVATLDPVTVALAIIVISSIYLFLRAINKSSGPRVRQINIYPIKSCAEIQVASATVTPRGFEHDRIFQVVVKSSGDDDASWTYCTPREKKYEKLFHVQPSVLYGGAFLKLTSSQVQKKEERITTDVCLFKLKGNVTSTKKATVMGDAEVSLDDYGDNAAGWLERATGIEGCRLVGIGDGFNRSVEVNSDQGDVVPTEKNAPVSLADEAPFLLTSQESLDDLNIRLISSGKDAIDMRRFRPNIVISGLSPWEEDTLKRIKIGSTEFHVWQRCGRCTMTTIDRDSLSRCGEPLSTLSSFRERENGQRNFGMHLIPVAESIEGDR